MRAYLVTETTGPEAIQTTERPEPEAGPGEVVVRIRATSLNYRDLIITNGGYPRNEKRPVVPVSDGAGEIEAVGEGVEGWAPGDRVAINFMRDWATGPVSERALASGFGGSVDGMLTEKIAVPQHTLVRIPELLSFEEAATLPCAALTAWNALTEAGVTAGQTALLLGTGGVSIFALQFAHAMGLRTIITSSSDAKLETARSLGADETINYRETPEWQERALELTGGEGVDIAVEVGGPGTLERSLASTRVGGSIALIGLLSEGTPSVLPALLNKQTIRGVYVGSTETFAAMNRAITQAKIKPVIDQVFPFDKAKDAYAHLAQQKHVGKVVISHG